jgi:hypothetical protein
MTRIERFEIDGTLTSKDVPLVRRFVEGLHRKISADASLLAMATHELLENAVKFSVDGSAFLRLEIADSTATVTTRNRASPGNVEVLNKIARDLTATADPMLYYLEQMGHRDRIGGLGLGRVAAEAEMKIEMSVLEDNTVEIKAATTFGARA